MYRTKTNHTERTCLLHASPHAPYVLLPIHVGEMPTSALCFHFMLPPYCFPPFLVLSPLLAVFSHFLPLILQTSHPRYLISPENFVRFSALQVQVDLTWLKIEDSVCTTLFYPAHLRLNQPG